MKIINGEALNKTLKAGMIDDIENGKLSGAVALVMQNGKCVASVCEGYSDLEKEIPLKVNAMFRLASMTKPVTATAVLICKERGLLSLTDKVSEYFPQFKDKYVGIKNEKGEIIKGEFVGDKLRIINLLTHSNGIVTGEVGCNQFDTMTMEDRRSLKSATDWYANNLLLDFMPDTKEAYSPVAAFDIAARIVEMVTDTPFNEFIDKNIFIPLGIKDVTCNPTDEQWERTVKMHNRSEDGKGYTNDNLYRKRFENIEYFSGGASLVGSAEDYAVFASMLMNGGIYNGVRIISEESVNLMKTPYILWHESENWGLGVRVIEKDPYLPKDTFGWSGAYGTHFWIDRQNRIVAVYMKNSYYDNGAEALSSRKFEEDVYKNLKP